MVGAGRHQRQKRAYGPKLTICQSPEAVTRDLRKTTVFCVLVGFDAGNTYVAAC
jgi:hypothetical protein